MASPLVSDGRMLNPREKAHFTVQLGDRITGRESGREGAGLRSVRYNHKPPLSYATRKTSLAASSTNNYTLALSDQDREGKNTDVFTFVGQKTQLPRKTSYVLLFDPAGQKATLEPLDETFTFNLSKKNGVDVEGEYTKIYPKKQQQSRDSAVGGVNASQDTTISAGGDDLFGEEAGNGHTRAALENEEPDPDNPYDFRHFLSLTTQGTAEGGNSKRGDESEYGSPDYRTGTVSAKGTPVIPAKKAVTAAATQAGSGRKRKEPEADPLVGRKTKSAASTTTKSDKKTQQTATATMATTTAPRVRLDHRATTHSKSDAKSKRSRKAAASSTGKVIKSAEIVHSSDEDSDGDDMHLDISTTRRPTSPPHATHDEASDRDAEGFSDDSDMGGAGGGGGLEIEVPDAHPHTRRPNALSSLGLGLGGLGHLRSPSAGPISLASAANSVAGSPRGSQRGARADEVIEFGDIGGGGGSEEEEEGEEEEEEGERDAEGEWEDRDVEPMDLGPPAQGQETASGSVAQATTTTAPPVEEDEDDPLYKEMMEGLAGDSSEESEEE
ncbi:uncharacterized protein EI97DRAFT_431142 [Westerdykella ornata]|uniref:Transcription elongation factor Eaf N-terminal domain-containing protein n=1 Tax=Westerdykella ornata TaxID=318751 RepID=A0A6A6JSQ6_WESOR|nr:uncharacterized protein EI97DRAFT_431142 [Westerdykella ornata]KAF2278898.1 hypothetical protein EI97DRAFT_431142 [Westerdykella ornata]